MSNEPKRSQGIDRRGFLGAAAAATVGASGCSRLLGGEASPGSSDRATVRVVLARIEEALDDLAGTRPVSELLAEDGIHPDGASPPLRELLERADEMARRTGRALVLSGMLLDVPEGARSSPEYQTLAALRDRELDATVIEHLGILRSCPPGELRRADEGLRGDPSPVMRICGQMDRWSGERGLGAVRRGGLRSAGRLLERSLAQRPLAEVLDRCASAVEGRLLDHGADPVAIDEVYRVSEGFWRGLPGAGELAAVKTPEQEERPPSAEVPGARGGALTGPGRPPRRRRRSLCVEREGNRYYVQPQCPPRDPAGGERDLRELPLDEMNDGEALAEYHQWSGGGAGATSSDEVDEHGRDRRHRIGRSLLITGAFTSLACGLGMFFMIAGTAVIYSSATYQAHRERRRRERRNRRR